MPCAAGGGWATVTVSDSPFRSLSLSSTAMVTGWAGPVSASSSAATGGAFSTVTVTVAVPVAPSSSVIVYWKVTTPRNVGGGT